MVFIVQSSMLDRSWDRMLENLGKTIEPQNCTILQSVAATGRLIPAGANAGKTSDRRLDMATARSVEGTWGKNQSGRFSMGYGSPTETRVVVFAGKSSQVGNWLPRTLTAA